MSVDSRREHRNEIARAETRNMISASIILFLYYRCGINDKAVTVQKLQFD